MEQIVGQRIWTASKWSWRSHQRNQHNKVHSKTQRAKHTNERRDVWTICMLHPSRENRNTSNALSGWRQQNQLPRQIAIPTSKMLVTKLLLNSVISTHGTRFMTMDIANFYLITPLNALNMSKSNSGTYRISS